jgi:hypothetical protein
MGLIVHIIAMMFRGKGRWCLKENILGISSNGVSSLTGGWKKPRRGSGADLSDSVVGTGVDILNKESDVQEPVRRDRGGI